jgi:molybdopterin biosynthesis enzyme
MTKFKVGDKVVVIEPMLRSFHDKIFSVSKVDEYAWIRAKGEDYAVYDDWVRKVTKLDKALK